MNTRVPLIKVVTVPFKASRIVNLNLLFKGTVS
jgi:hypothetical protein